MSIYTLIDGTSDGMGNLYIADRGGARNGVCSFRTQTDFGIR